MKDTINPDEEIEMINNAIIDTRFVLDSAKPSKGIYKTLMYWCLSHFIISTVLSIVSALALNYGWIETEYYYPIYRISAIILYLVPSVVYLIYFKKTDMTLKEMNFLKMYSFIPICISLFKILFPISYYINVDFLFALYDVLPFDIVLIMFGLIQLYLYFEDKRYMTLIIGSGIYVIFYSIIKIICRADGELTEFMMILINIRNFLEDLNDYAIFIAIIMFISLNVMKKIQNEQ